MADRRQRPRTAVARLPARVARRSDAARFLPSPRSILVGVALLLVSVVVYAGARESSLFAVRTIEVRGGDPRIAREVHDALAAEIGVSLLKLDPRDVERRLRMVPDVRSATLDRSFPHVLVVTVRVERPVAVLRQGARAWLVSTGGRVLRPVKLGGALELPRIWLKTGVTVRPGGTLRLDDGRRAAAALAPLAGTSLASRVLLVRAGGDEVTLVLRSGVELRLGDVGDLRLKLTIARRILPLIAEEARPGSYLDVSVPERPVAHTNPQVGG